MVNRRLCVLSVGLLLAAGGCRTGRPDYTVNVPPNVLDVRPPRSVLFIDTPLRLEALDQAMLRAMPGGGSGGAKLGMLDARWQLQRQVPSVTAAPPGLLLRLPVTGSLSVGAGFLRCQSNGVGGVFNIAARPTLDAGGALMLADARVTLEPVGTMQCAGVPVPVSELFALMLRPIEQSIGQALGSGLGQLRLPLGPALQKGLAELAVPRSLNLDGQKACLDLDPAGLVVAPMAGAGQTAALRLGVDVAPRLSLGDCPNKVLPAQRALVVSEALAGAAAQSRVAVAVAVPAADLQAPLSKALMGRRFGSGQQSVVVNSVALGDASGRALVRLGVTGAFNGNLFLWGTPQVRVEGGRYVLGVPDLQLAGESTSRLEELRLNLIQLFDGDLAGKLRPVLVLDVTERLQQVQKRLSGTLEVNRSAWQQQAGAGTVAGVLGVSAIALRSQLTELQPVGVESRPGVLVAYVMLVGTLQLDVR